MFQLYVGRGKKAAHILLLCMKERRSQQKGDGSNPTSSSTALTSAQNRQLALSQRPEKVTLENKLKPLPIVMQLCHRQRAENLTSRESENGHTHTHTKKVEQDTCNQPTNHKTTTSHSGGQKPSIHLKLPHTVKIIK